MKVVQKAPDRGKTHRLELTLKRRLSLAQLRWAAWVVGYHRPDYPEEVDASLEAGERYRLSRGRP